MQDSFLFASKIIMASIRAFLDEAFGLQGTIPFEKGRSKQRNLFWANINMFFELLCIKTTSNFKFLLKELKKSRNPKQISAYLELLNSISNFSTQQEMFKKLAYGQSILETS